MTNAGNTCLSALLQKPDWRFHFLFQRVVGLGFYPKTLGKHDPQKLQCLPFMALATLVFPEIFLLPPAMLVSMSCPFLKTFSLSCDCRSSEIKWTEMKIVAVAVHITLCSAFVCFWWLFIHCVFVAMLMGLDWKQKPG